MEFILLSMEDQIERVNEHLEMLLEQHNETDCDFTAFFEQAFLSEFWQVKLFAMEGMKFCYNFKDILKRMINIIETKKYPAKVRAGAVKCLSDFFDPVMSPLKISPDEFEYLYKIFYKIILNKNEVSVIRGEALKSIASLGGKKILDIIFKFYNSMDHDLKICSIAAMGINGAKRWGQNLVSDMMSPDHDISIEAISSIGLGEYCEAVPKMLEYYQKADTVIKKEILCSIGNINAFLSYDGLKSIASKEHDESLSFLAFELQKI